MATLIINHVCPLNFLFIFEIRSDIEYYFIKSTYRARARARCSIHQSDAYTCLEFQIYVQPLDPTTDMMDHCEHRLPDHMAPLLLEEESHVHGDAEAQLAGVR